MKSIEIKHGVMKQVGRVVGAGLGSQAFEKLG